MARFRRILRLSVWWCCLLCVLSVAQSVSANTRKSVTMPSAASVATGGGSASRSGGSLSVPGTPIQEYIPRTPGGTSGTPIKVLPTIDYSIPRTINGVKGVLRSTPVALAGSLAVSAMLEAIDGIIDQAQDVVLVPTIVEIPQEDDKIYWQCQHAGCTPQSSPQAASTPSLKSQGWDLDARKVEFDGCQVNGTLAICSFKEPLPSNSDAYNYYTVYVNRFGNECPTGGTYVPETGQCVSFDGLRPATPGEIDEMGSFANGQNADWLKGLLNDYCAGSIAPQRCFDEMADNSSLSGPSSVPGPSTTSTGTYTRPDGTTGTTGTTNNTNYNITYGNNYYNYTSTTTTTTSKDGVTTETNTSTDAGSPAVEEKPDKQDEEEEQPSPCIGSGCDGPAYADLYEPTDETKEQHIDGYLSRIGSIPIFQAVTGLFDVQVGGSCPVWEVHQAMPILGYNFSINLVFDFLCLPWIVSMGPWIRAVIYAVATGYAIRVALL
jgi:hypothetical protein